MADETAELLVSIKADLSDLKAKFESSQQDLTKFSEKVGTSFSKLGEIVAGAFALDKVIGFAKDSINAFGEMQRSMELLGNAVTSAGLDWEKSKDSLQSYADKIESTTRFQDDVVLSSMAELVGVTKDIGAALKLNELAMDLAVGKNMGLAEASNMLSLAFAGNERGISQLARSLKVTGDNAKDVSFLIGEVERRFSDAAEKEQNLSTEMSKLGKEFENLGKDLVSTFEPAIRATTDLIKGMIGVLRDATKEVNNFFGAVNEKSSHEDITEKIQKERQLIETMRFGLRETEKQIAITSGVAKQTLEIRANTLRQQIEMHEKSRKNLVNILKQEKNDVKASESDKVKAIAEANRMRLENEKATAELIENMEKEDLRKAKEREKEREELAKKQADYISSSFQDAASKMAIAFKEGNLSVEKSFEILGKSILKSIVNAMADAMMASSVKDFIEASAAAASIVGAAAAPGLYASAGIKAAGAGTIRGLAEVALAEGGYVDAPTLALIGEKGPEKVTPLSKGHPMDQGGGKFTYNMSFPNVKSAKDFTNRDVATVARRLFTTQQDLKTRSGNRNTSF